MHPSTGESDAVHAVMARQRACRSYRPDPVDDQVLVAVLESATRAPSAQNRQPWQFVVVTAADRRAAIWDLAERVWHGGASQAMTDELPGAMYADVAHGLTGGFAGAPVTIVVGADLDRCRRETIGSSLFPAVQNLLLAATAHGLGSALTTIATAFADELSTLVGFPEHISPVAVIPLGHPTAPLGRSRREPLADHAHRETYGHGGF